MSTDAMHTLSLEWDLADRLVKARRLGAVKQTEIADYLGITRQSVGAYESGLVVPRVGFLRLWAMRCGVPFEWLRDGDLPTGPYTDDNPGDTGDNQVIHLKVA